MNLSDWFALYGAYWPDRKSRLIYAIQHMDGPDECGQLPAMGWVCAIQLVGEIMKEN